VPWPEEYARRYADKGYWEGHAIGDRLHSVADATPDAVALVDGDRRLTYRQLTERAAQDHVVTQDLNTLLTALYVKIDDEIGGTRWMGRPPLLTDSELVCLAVAQALSAGTGSGTPLAQCDGEAFQVCANAVSPTGLLGIATAATCFGVLLGRFRGRGRPGR
jgi:hypothetical protein